MLKKVMTTITVVDIQTIISNIERNQVKASALFNSWIYSNDPFDEPSRAWWRATFNRQLSKIKKDR